MESIPTNHLKATRIVVDSFAETAGLLAEEGGRLSVEPLAQFSDRIWSETIRHFETFPMYDMREALFPFRRENLRMRLRIWIRFEAPNHCSMLGRLSSR